MKLFNDDPETDAIIMVGEIGGDAEETCARWIKDNMEKPIVGFIAGVTAPPREALGPCGGNQFRRQGHRTREACSDGEVRDQSDRQSRRDGSGAQVDTVIQALERQWLNR